MLVGTRYLHTLFSHALRWPVEITERVHAAHRYAASATCCAAHRLELDTLRGPRLSVQVDYLPGVTPTLHLLAGGAIDTDCPNPKVLPLPIHVPRSSSPDGPDALSQPGGFSSLRVMCGLRPGRRTVSSGRYRAYGDREAARSVTSRRGIPG